MKNKIFVFIATLIFGMTLSGPLLIQAATPTLTPASTSSSSSELIDKLKKIELLKEKIATKVAEIRNKDKSAASGAVNKIEDKTISVNSKKGELTIGISDDTQYLSLLAPEKAESTLKKIKLGDKISVFGYYSEDKSILNAKFIFLQNNVIHFSGKIADIDKEKYTVTVKSKQEQILIDIESYTKTFIYNSDKKSLVKSGFSKIKTGDVMHVIGINNAKEENRMSANKLWIYSPVPVLLNDQ